jgi:L-alanine-DL-glutamate epimerase-like enolase superfamily enzyme
MRENAPLGTMTLDSGSGRPDEIVEIDIALLRVPLRRPVKIAIAEIPFREFNVVRVRTADGTVGTGYARGGVLVDVALRECIAPTAMGAAADGIEWLWDHIYRLNIQVGRRGAVLRAMSAFDIALWDVRARRAGLPLWRLLGGTRRQVPVYASGGYYGVGRDDGGLRAELELYRASGFAAVKIKVAGATVADDVRRVELVREVMGDTAIVMVDANCGYDDRRDDALQMAQELGRLGVRFFEEPFGPDRIEDLEWLAGLGPVPIASGVDALGVRAACPEGAGPSAGCDGGRWDHRVASRCRSRRPRGTAARPPLLPRSPRAACRGMPWHGAGGVLPAGDGHRELR